MCISFVFYNISLFVLLSMQHALWRGRRRQVPKAVYSYSLSPPLHKISLLVLLEPSVNVITLATAMGQSWRDGKVVTIFDAKHACLLVQWDSQIVHCCWHVIALLVVGFILSHHWPSVDAWLQRNCCRTDGACKYATIFNDIDATLRMALSP